MGLNLEGTNCELGSPLAGYQIVSHRAGGTSDIHHSEYPFQLVMAGLVKKVADSNHSHSFSGEVHRQPGGGRSKEANHGIQIPSATLQVGASHREIGGTEACRGGEQQAIFPVPKLVLDGSGR